MQEERHGKPWRVTVGVIFYSGNAKSAGAPGSFRGTSRILWHAILTTPAAVTQRRPRVAFAIVGLSAGFDVMVDGAQARRVHVMLVQGARQLVEELLRGRFRRTVLGRVICAKSDQLGGCRMWRSSRAESSVERLRHPRLASVTRRERDA